jgi:tRNA A-37 threonylcarbamoyl transferase component Bud32
MPKCGGLDESTAKRGASGRACTARKGAASAPAPLDALRHRPPPGDYAEFLRITLPKQQKNVASHRLGSERVWLKKAGPRHGKWGYRVMAAVARMARLDIIKPVPNPGGEAAIATEARRLKQLAAAGLRVPTVLAQQPDGLLISDLGESGRATVVLQERLDQAAAAGPAALLAVWREGLAAIAAVHVRGQHLSQAFDRNLVQCPDGVIGYIDFEDDPAEVMTLAECQARDWLSYLHSTAMMLEAAAPQAAGQHWHAALATVNEEVRERIANAARRMKWARKLPASRRWGRDTQRVRAVARLLGRWHDPRLR